MKPVSEKRNMETVIKTKHKEPSTHPKVGMSGFSFLISLLICVLMFLFNKENFPFNTRTLWWPTPKSLPGPGIGQW